MTLAAHEICKIAYPDPVELQQFLEKASRDWYNPDYHVYLMMYLSLAFESAILSLGIPLRGRNHLRVLVLLGQDMAERLEDLDFGSLKQFLRFKRLVTCNFRGMGLEVSRGSFGYLKSQRAQRK